jgi:hypothetical protein
MGGTKGVCFPTGADISLDLTHPVVQFVSEALSRR